MKCEKQQEKKNTTKLIRLLSGSREPLRFLRDALQLYADDVIILPSNSLKKVLANYVCLFFAIVGRRIYLVHAVVVTVVPHQNSVHVTLLVPGVVVPPDFIGQVLRAGRVEVSNGIIAVLLFVCDDWEQLLFVEELMKAVLPPRGITQSHHVVVEAALDVPHQQLQTVARRRLTEAAVLQLLL